MTRPVGPTLAVTLSNPRADRVRHVKALVGRSARAKEVCFLVEGPQAVREAVRFAAPRIRDVYVSSDAAARHPGILSEALAAGLRVHGCTPEVVTAMSGDAQGVLAVVEVSTPSLAETLTTEVRLVVILNNVRDPGNVGTIIRVADAAGADAVVLAGECVDLHSPKVVRASVGSLFHLPVVEDVALADAVAATRDAGMAVWAASGSGEDDLFSLARDPGEPMVEPVAWVFGNEAWGLDADDLERADRAVRIPLFGAAESLNVAAAVAVALYMCDYSRSRDRGTAK